MNQFTFHSTNGNVAKIFYSHMPDSTALNNYVKSLAAQFKSQKEYNEVSIFIHYLFE